MRVSLATGHDLGSRQAGGQACKREGRRATCITCEALLGRRHTGPCGNSYLQTTLAALFLKPSAQMVPDL